MPVCEVAQWGWTKDRGRAILHVYRTESPLNIYYPSSKVGPVMAPAPDQETPTTSEPVWLTPGAAYCVEDGALLCTPRYLDGSYDNLCWSEVEFDDDQLKVIQDAIDLSESTELDESELDADLFADDVEIDIA